jgi:hypothetical protein
MKWENAEEKKQNIDNVTTTGVLAQWELGQELFYLW